MGAPVRTVVTIVIDSYDSRGNLIGVLLGKRASSRVVDPHDALRHFTSDLPADWRQMTYDEVAQHLATTSEGVEHSWEQLSIF